MDYSLLTSLTVNVISFSIGTTGTWSSPMTEVLTNGGTKSPFIDPISIEEMSWIVSLESLGAVFGPFLFGYLPDRIGRKYAVLSLGIPILLGCILIVTTKSLCVFYVARFLSGLSGGGVFNLIPIYIGEIASSHNRGALSATLNLFLCTGLLFSYCVGPYVSFLAFNISLVVFPAVFLVMFSLIGVESPYYYVKKGRKDLAKEVLQKLRGRTANVEAELVDICKFSEQTKEKGSLSDIVSDKELKRASIIVIGLLFFQQLSGIVAILVYSESIFTQAGVNLEPAICSIIIGVVQIIVSSSIPLTIDRLGRRNVLLISSIGVFLSESVLTIYTYLRDNNYDVSQVSILPLVCLIAYMTVYTFGLGPLPWIIMGEIFPSEMKSTATTLATFIDCTLSFLVAKYFQIISNAVGMGAAFLIFTCFSAVSMPFIYFLVVETKGKTLQEVTEELSK